MIHRTIRNSVLIVALLMSMRPAATAIEIEVLFQGKILQHLATIADMCLTNFKPFPYCYNGEASDDDEYIKELDNAKHGALVVARDEGKIVGIITGMPLSAKISYCLHYLSVFKEHGYIPEDYYYFGEVIVAPTHQKLGIAKQMFSTLEKTVQNWRYKGISLITSVRADDDPRKPEGYSSTDVVWEKFGCIKTQMTKSCTWCTFKEDGTSEESENIVAFWIKELLS